MTVIYVNFEAAFYSRGEIRDLKIYKIRVICNFGAPCRNSKTDSKPRINESTAKAKSNLWLVRGQWSTCSNGDILYREKYLIPRASDNVSTLLFPTVFVNAEIYSRQVVSITDANKNFAGVPWRIVHCETCRWCTPGEVRSLFQVQ